MKKFFYYFAIFLYTIGAISQTPPNKGDTPFTTEGIFSTPPTADFPKNVHDYALQKIKEFDDYQKSKPSKLGTLVMVEQGYSFSFRFNSSTTVQSFSLDKDGKFIGDNLSMEDALLWMVAMDEERRLAEQKRWDRSMKESEDAIKSVPPAKFRFGGERWLLYNGPAWTYVNVSADTTCAIKRVRVLEDDHEKQSDVFHELMHVASGCRNGARVHEVISNLSGPLLKLLQENPDMVDYLFRKPTYTVWPKVVSAHLVLDSVQAKQQDHPIPVCTEDSTTTCYDPALPTVNYHAYSKKENCEDRESVKCVALAEYWLPIGKPVVYDESEKP